MKRRVLFFAAFIISAGSIFAQSEMDVYKMSQTDLTGTARSVSMGGAFGALGGDISGIAINPAGIGVYRSSEIVTTMNFQNAKTTVESNLSKMDDSKFKFTFDNLAFVAAFPTSSDVAPFINFGFSYNRIKNFDRKYSMSVANSNNTIADYMAYRAGNEYYGSKEPHDALFFKDTHDTAPFDYDWMAVFGYNSGLIDYDNDGFYAVTNVPVGADNKLFVREKGSVNTYDFNVGTTLSDIISLGLTVSVTDLKYRLYYEFSELYGSNSYANIDSDIRTDGTGYQVSAGIIVKPVNELRIGLAYHSPTWYNMTDTYAADFTYDLVGIGLGETKGWVYSDFYHYDYKMRTPDRWTASIAGVIGQTAIISADYEYTNYRNNMKLFEDNGNDMPHDPNFDIKNHFKGASTIRVGAEIRFTPQFSGRVGYQWKQSPLKKEFKDYTGTNNIDLEPKTVGTVNHYTLDGDTNYITYGLGYRFNKSFYTDIAFVMKTQKADIHTYYGSERSEWKDNTFQGLMTIGYRF